MNLKNFMRYLMHIGKSTTQSPASTLLKMQQRQRKQLVLKKLISTGLETDLIQLKNILWNIPHSFSFLTKWDFVVYIVKVQMDLMYLLVTTKKHLHLLLLKS